MKKFLAFVLALTMVLCTVAMAEGYRETVINEDGIIGTGAVTFDTTKEMSGTLKFWFYEDGKRFIEPLIEDYKTYRPNVDLQVTYIAWNDYWTKLPVSLGTKEAPDLYYFHNSYHSLLINEGMQDPYPQELVDGLMEDVIGMSQYVYDGNVYYAPTGTGHGIIYYNKDLWAAAGLTDEDFPETWEELKVVAEKLTQREGDQLMVSGFNLNPFGSWFARDMVLQSGHFEFTEDSLHSNFNNEDTKAVWEFFKTFYDENIISATFPEANQSFMDGTSAMVPVHPYFAGTLNANAPDINYGVFPEPRFENGVCNYHYHNPDCSMGINAAASDEAKELAVDMLHLFFADDKYLEEWCYEQNLAPLKTTLQDSEALLANPVLSVVMADLPNALYVGAVPGTYTTILKNSLFDPIIYGGASWDDCIEGAMMELDAYLADANFVAVERSWDRASELK